MFVISSILKQMSCRPNYPCFFLFSFFSLGGGGGRAGLGEYSNCVYTRSLGAVFSLRSKDYFSSVSNDQDMV